MTPKLIVEQKITPFANKYAVYAANPDGSKGQMVAFAQQKRLAFKEKVSFYTDESKSTLAFTFRAEKVMDIHGRYFVEDQNGQMVGGFQKAFTESLVRSTWNILGSDGNPKLVVTESSQVLAVMRRFGGMIPIVGELVDLAVLFLRYHFVLLDTTGNTIGFYKKTRLLYDHYALSMTDEAYNQTDPRVLIAQAVALDALQSR